MGPSRKTVIQNRDIIKELKVGMLIAIAESDITRVGKVLAIPSNISLDSNITIQWMVQERAPHKPKWQRIFKFGAKDVFGETELKNVLLFDFELTIKKHFRNLIFTWEYNYPLCQLQFERILNTYSLS